MYLLGRDIRNMRCGIGMTQESFSASLGVSVSTLRLWERMIDSTVTGMMHEKFLNWLARSLPMRDVPRKFRYTVKKMKGSSVGSSLSLREKVSAVLGRPAEVVNTVHGKLVVEYFNFNVPPPPEGDTEEEALEKFLEYHGSVVRNEENTDASDNDLPG